MAYDTGAQPVSAAAWRVGCAGSGEGGGRRLGMVHTVTDESQCCASETSTALLSSSLKTVFEKE